MHKSGASIATSLGLAETLCRCPPPCNITHMQLVTKSYLPQKYKTAGPKEASGLLWDPSQYWSALARWPIDWTWQPVNTKRYEVFMTFFTSVSQGATTAMDWTMKHHPSEIDGEEQYEVQAIRKHRVIHGET